MITNLDAIKTAMPMAKTLSALGIEVDSQGKCACPVHQGTHKNFSVRGDFGFCWSQCGRSWDSVGLVMELKRYTFLEAVEWLAAKSGVDIESESGIDRVEVVQRDRESRARRDRLAKIAAQAADYFQHLATWPSIADQDLINVDGRTIKRATLEAFRIGKAPEKHGLREYAKAHAIAEGDLLTIGVLADGPTGVYDTFRDGRTMFPHLDERGAVIGFAGRLPRSVQVSDKKPKYINSKGSDLYQKGSELYGLRQNLRGIRRKKAIAIVEGPWDVITMHDHGLDYAVASQGTALTAEHAYVIRRYTDDVILLRDGDEAGQKAARRDIQLLVEQQLNVRVLSLPAGDDPDSYLRTEGKSARGLELAIDDDSKDGIVWLVSSVWKKGDLAKEEEAQRLAAHLIACYDSEVRRDAYLAELCGRGKPMSSCRRTIAELIDTNRMRRVRTASDYTPKMESDCSHYGVFIKGNRYFAGTSCDFSHQISNFILEPIMLVVSEEGGRRVVKITNQFGDSQLLDLDAEAITEITGIKKIIETKGNYLFNESCKPDHWIRIKRKLYDEMLKAYHLPILGWNRMGFYAFANGVIKDGKFRPVDANGIVKIDENRYFLPEHSDLRNALMENLQSDDFARTFVYAAKAEPADFQAWSNLLVRVLGGYGIIGLAYVLAVVHRSVIYQHVSVFPHLNLFGPPGSGKSYLAWRLRALFGEKRQPLNVVHCTDVAFYRELAKAKDALVWCDEYSNEIRHNRVEALKSAYDGVGRTKGVATNDNRTTVTPVHSALILSGQTQPTSDVALFTRCISLSFSKKEFSQEDRLLSEKLEAMESDAALTTLMPLLLSVRKEVERSFIKTYSDYREKWTSVWPSGLSTDERMVVNNCILLAVAKIYATEMELPFKVDEELLPLLKQVAIQQSKAMSEEDETGVWWDLIAFGITQKQLEPGHAFTRVLGTIRCQGITGQEVVIDGAKVAVVGIAMNDCYRYYQGRLTSERAGKGLNKMAMIHYLKHSKAYVGYSKSIRYSEGSRTNSAYLFRLDLLPDGLGIYHQENEELFTPSTIDEDELPF